MVARYVVTWAASAAAAIMGPNTRVRRCGVCFKESLPEKRVVTDCMQQRAGGQRNFARPCGASKSLCAARMAENGGWTRMRAQRPGCGAAAGDFLSALMKSPA